MRAPDVEADITLLSTAEGGRAIPASSGYRPQHKVLGEISTSATHHYIGCSELLPGQTAHGTITFMFPGAYPHCLWAGREIEILEGSRVVGRARITKILNPLLEKVS